MVSRFFPGLGFAPIGFPGGWRSPDRQGGQASPGIAASSGPGLRRVAYIISIPILRLPAKREECSNGRCGLALGNPYGGEAPASLTSYTAVGRSKSEDALDNPLKMIAVIRGASSATVEDMFRALVDLWRPDMRLAGLVAEGHGLPDRFCNAGFLRNVTTGERFSIFRDLGPGTAVCHLDGTGAVAAAAAVRCDLAAGCDLVVLSKFGKLEAAGDGLVRAFEAAIEARVPLLTSVSPALDEAWRKFVGRPFVILPADLVEIDAWRCAVRAAVPTSRLLDDSEQLRGP